MSEEAAESPPCLHDPPPSRPPSHPAGWSEENKIHSEYLMYHQTADKETQTIKKMVEECVSGHLEDK